MKSYMFHFALECAADREETDGIHVLVPDVESTVPVTVKENATRGRERATTRLEC